MAKNDLTAQRLREVLDYDPDTGVFTWKARLGGRRLAGQPAGIVNKAIGYAVIGLDGCRYYAHRLAWMFVHGRWPILHIDHINGDRADNRIANLRDVSAQTNMQNMRDAPGGGRLIGASFDSKRGLFQSGIRVNGKRVRLGRFKTADEAHAAYVEAKRRLHVGCTI